MEMEWYASLVLPSWAPPAWLFGPVWTVLYVIIGVSFGFVAYKCGKHELPLFLALPFGLNLFFNLMFSPIQFGLRNNLLASLDIALVLSTLVWALVVIRPHFRWVALVNLLYLLWVCFATVLQFTITSLNW